jgi:hypothetical protein
MIYFLDLKITMTSKKSSALQDVQTISIAEVAAEQ